MNVLIIGATGFIGSNVGQAFAAGGHAVVGLSRDPAKAPRLRAIGMDCAVGDLGDPVAVGRIIADMDAVVFAPQVLADAEHQIVGALLDGMAGSGKTFIFTSGTGVLGQRTLGAWSQDSFAEDDPFTPLAAIARRVETETLVRDRAGAGVRTLVIRPPRVWGKGARGHVSMAYQSIARTGAACYIGAGLNMYSNVHIDDLSNLYALALAKGTAGALYHAVSGEMANRWIAQAVAGDMGCATRSVTMDEAMAIWGRYQTLIVLSVSSRSRAVRSRLELGWTPTRLDMLDEIGLDAFRALAAPDIDADQPVSDGRAATLLGA